MQLAVWDHTVGPHWDSLSLLHEAKCELESIGVTVLLSSRTCSASQVGAGVVVVQLNYRLGPLGFLARRPS